MSEQEKKLRREKGWFGITPTLWWNDDSLSIDIGIPFKQCISEMALAGFIGCSIGHKYPTDFSVLGGFLPGSEPEFISPGLTLHTHSATRIGGVDDRTSAGDTYS